MDSPMAEAGSPLPSSTTKCSKLKEDELARLNAQFNGMSKSNHWPQQLQDASEDPGKMTKFMSLILMFLIDELLQTTAKANFIPPMAPNEAKIFVEGFDPDERQAWEDGIRKCMQLSDWGGLIAHPSLQKPEIIPISRASSETTAERAERLHSMFSREYQGDFHHLFVQAFNDYENIYDPKKHFGRIIPIIQSSGTGKSRMVKEIGNMVPTLSICFRRSASPESGWPPPDEPARDFLLGERYERYKGEELAAAFLGAVMVVVAEKIEARGDSVTQKGDWMDDWRLDSAINIPDSLRYTYFAEVAARAENLLLDNNEAIVTTRVSYNIENIPFDATIDSAPVWHNRLFHMLCRSSFEKLVQVLKKRNVKRFLLAVDECSELNRNKPVPVFGQKPYRAPLWGMSLIALQHIIKAYDDFVTEVPVWFLLLDTNSTVINMAPLSKEAASDRFEKGYRSLPPWPYVGFNQMAMKNVFAFANEKRLPTHVHSMQHLKRYGRPYWATLTDMEVLGVASKKLFSDNGFRPNQVDHVFAAFAIRVGLEIGVGEASECLAMEAVRSHMRILDAIVESMVITTSPPEPILAIAAAMAMTSSEERYKTALETLLDELILKGVVLDRGLLGELSSRLLLLRARDKATLGRFVKSDPNSKLPTVQPVKLSTFLQTLLGNALGVSDKQRKVRDNLLQEASLVWINFTHIYQMPLSIGEVTESMLLNAWSTGAAFQCAHNQPVIDGFIVGYHGSLDEPFQSSCLITIPWQSKAKSTAAGSALAHSLTAPFIVPQNGGSRYKPWHVVILMDLASSSAFGKSTGPRCDLVCEKALRPKRGEEGREVWKSYAEPNESEGQRYCLNIRGHCAVNYPVLNGLEEQFDKLFMRALSCSEPAFVPYVETMAKAKGCIILD